MKRLRVTSVMVFRMLGAAVILNQMMCTADDTLTGAALGTFGAGLGNLLLAGLLVLLI